MTLNMWISTLAWALLAFGYCRRFERSVHYKLMLAGIGLDIGMVLYLQVTRHAIQKAAEFSLSWPQQFHIFFSTVALVLYFPVLYLGVRLVLGKAGAKEKALHVRIASTALILRSVGFVLMFSMWKY